MKGRSTLLAMMAGSGGVQLGAALGASALPPLAAVAGAGVTMAVGIWLRRRYGQAGANSRRLRAGRGLFMLAWLLWMIVLGASYTVWRADERLVQALDVRHENFVTRLTLRLDSLAVGDDSFQRAEATVLHSPVAGVPRQLWLGWPAPAEGGIPELVPGDVYSAAVVLKRPHGPRNPRAFDAEAWMFERGLRARATVRGEPVLLARPAWAGAGVAVERARYQLRRALRNALGDARYGPVVIALALGDQASVPASDWEVFSRTGIIHLVSISGLHVTLLAGLAGAAALWLWKRGSWRGLPLPEYGPARTAGAIVALLAAWLYCLVAGWGVPAQRTFFMLATVGMAAVLRLPISASRLLPLAAWIILALDPWAVMSPGFWLSFGAVAVLMLLGSGRWRRRQGPPWRRALIAAALVQGAMTVALVPMLALQFHEVSLASPLANALAIPVVSFLVTPLALLGMLFSPWPGLVWLGQGSAWLAERIFRWMMVPVAWMAEADWAVWPVAAPPWPLGLLALAGCVYALLPAGLPARWLGWSLLLPLFFYQPARPRDGEWRLAALDVGQGSAIVIETRRHVVVFDTGPPLGRESDAGDRVVWPHLRARGWRRIDDLVVSHGDADHAGGVASLLRRVPVRRLRAQALPGSGAQPVGRAAPRRGEGEGEGEGATSRFLPSSANATPPRAACRAGQGWQLDGVSFRVLHPAGSPGAGAWNPETTPPEPQAGKPHGNATSCVLRVQGWWHAALLPGDIEAAQERWMVEQGLDFAADVVLMPHHGSSTSSTPPWVSAAEAKVAIAQAGYLSRFGHPRPEVVRRWRESGARVLSSASHGAVIVNSTSEGLDVKPWRQHARRYWHTDVAEP